ncbi:hypothetical protein [Corallococcus llansteffanensis]|nr:hypothetical protein [Corallococcus llansteffanensis]
MRPCILALSLLALIGAPRAEAANNAVAIIWKGAKTQAEAEAQKPAWSDLNTALGKAGLTFRDGYPKLVESKTLPGLKPGFWVWLLGVCAPDDAPPIVDQIKLLSPETYSREVKVSPKQRSCPRQEDEALGSRDETLALRSGATLRVFTHAESENVAEHEERWDYSTRTRYLFVLFGKSGEVLGSADAVGDEVVNKSGGGGATYYRCDGTQLEKSAADTFVLTRHCDAGGAAECGSVASADEFVTVKVNSSAVFASAPQRIHIQRAECD